MTAEEAREALISWRENFDRRDQVVREAAAAGVTKHQIHVLTGIARTTINRILESSGKGGE